MENIEQLFASWKGRHQEDLYLKSFKDAGYHYSVIIKFNSILENEAQCGISIIVDASVGEVGMDLVKYAMGHIIEEAGDQIKILEKEIELEWTIVSVLVTGMDYFGSILNIIGSVPSKMMSFQELNRSILNSKNTPLNLSNLEARKENKKNKLIKTLDYLIQHFKDEYVKEIKYSIESKLEKIDDEIDPYVTITFFVYHTYHDNTPAIYGGTLDTYTSEIKDSLTEELHQISPVDLSNKKDRIIFNFIKAK
jgi:hypothetical protein